MYGSTSSTSFSKSTAIGNLGTILSIKYLIVSLSNSGWRSDSMGGASP